jgi:hypothetical protein
MWQRPSLSEKSIITRYDDDIMIDDIITRQRAAFKVQNARVKRGLNWIGSRMR